MTFLSPPLLRPVRLRIDWALAAAMALHLLFVATFFVILALATSQARAEEIACRGENLLATMAQDDPETMKRIKAEAAAIVNGSSLLWRIEKDGAAVSWLYGTMHTTDPRVLELGATARGAYDDAAVVVVESSQIVELERAMASLMTDPDLTMLDAGVTLEGLLSEEDFDLVETVLEERGIPMAFVSRMKPWLIFSMIAVPDCEIERRAKGIAFLDKDLATGALDSGKTLEGLETLKEQLSIVSGLPLDVQARLLADTAALSPVLDDVTATMTDLYLDGRIDMIMPFVEAATMETGELDSGAYAKFEKELIETRNKTMAERLDPILKDGGAFVAVGALHIPGKDGLVELLRSDGYTVTAVN
ncbi:TraB/GumN family protein [Hoeflea prorocentri]|uniref:TraB/GumN family protein n=1 Tax=Hoeflea prorocentri TaxID=1922333 RepID=A0A9X3UMF8_9HYPH|nr:TraB/GumN family protein [Hoeflea prorocentri]MCY6383423.1 TraB/GumN family protein [Hoeflea prorocentri]MDA5401223.1 TraB/GumN family protein [Hoeflea prorocentri]